MQKNQFDEIIIGVFNAQITFNNNLGIKTKYLGTCKFNFLNSRYAIATKYSYFFRSRLVVITQGADPVIVVQNGEVTLYDVTKLAADKIVDTNGAGNYFFFSIQM